MAADHDRARRAWKPFVAVATAGLVLVATAAVVSARTSGGRNDPKGHVELLRVPVGGGRTRAVDVYRPAVPDSSNLPVVYFLHGIPGTYHSAFDAGLARTLDRAIAGGAAPFVLATPDGNGTNHSDTEWANARDGTDQVETELLDKVIPAVEGLHPRSRDRRAIAGFSMGGYGAMNLAERHPDLFGQVVSISGYFNVDDPDGVFGGDPTTEAANEPDIHAGALRNTHVLLMEGDADTEPVVQGEAARFDAILAAAKIDHQIDIDNGNHHWTFVMGEAPTWVEFLERGWKT